MRYFRPFKSYAQFSVTKMKTLVTQSVPSQPVQLKKYLLHAHFYLPSADNCMPLSRGQELHQTRCLSKRFDIECTTIEVV